MKIKRLYILICLILCLFSIASVCASDVNDTLVTGKDAVQMDMSSNEIYHDDLQAIKDVNASIQTDNDETSNMKISSSAWDLCEGTYSDLSEEIGSGGNIELKYDYYSYNYGSSVIVITTPDSVIDGRGAIIDMTWSNIHAFEVKAFNVTIKNMTIENANYDLKNNLKSSHGGAIYFAESVSLGTVKDCNFINNQVNGFYSDGGAIRMESGTVENCNFISNSASGYGGAIRMESGTVENCNFISNSASGYGGAISMESGTVENCNFTNNLVSDKGGAVLVTINGNVTNCNFTNNNAYRGGAVYFLGDSEVTDCYFVNNIASRNGGAVYFLDAGDVTNCIFVNNKATGDNSEGGAIWGYSGSVTNCNLTNNVAMYGGAIEFDGTGTVTNCNLTNNTARYGGAIGFDDRGTVTNCNFVNNSANSGGAIFSQQWYTAMDTCIFKTGSDTNVNTVNFPPTLNVGNFTTFFNFGDKLTFDLKTNIGNQVCGGNVSISVYDKYSGAWIGSYNCLSGEGWTVALPVGTYYAIFNTEYAEFTPVNRTITIYPNNTFAALYYIINANDACEIYLTNDYYYDSFYDSEFTNGIVIKRNVAVNGNAITIDGKGQARAFNVQSCDVTIKNLTIKNNYHVDGGAIYFNSSGSLMNCTFINNTAACNGGAVYFNSSGSLMNCTFINNTAACNGGAVYLNGNGEMGNCNFINNKAVVYDSLGGAVWIYSGAVENCNFTNNSASYQGGAIESSDRSSIKNCNFVGNSACDYGGAARMNFGSIENCNFTNNSARYGGAINFNRAGNVGDCNFANNSASSYGDAIWFNGEANVSNCNFTNNKAIGNHTHPGAIYFATSSSAHSATNCSFTGNIPVAESTIGFNTSSSIRAVSNSTSLNINHLNLTINENYF